MNVRSTLASIFCFASFTSPLTASAQQLDLPRPSPLGKVSQVVGLTEIAVEYSSPTVKGRKIFGGLLKDDELWRTGANGATKITFSKDVMVADKPVPAGSYALFTIPSSKNPWTIILNKNVNQGGTGQYKQAEDLMRFTLKPQAIPQRERLAFIISDFTDNTANIDLEWEQVRVSIPVKLKTDEQAAANIKGLTESAWRPWNAAARYQLEIKKDSDSALTLVNQSLSLKEDWFNVWTKSQVMAAKGNTKEAIALAEKAQTLGGKAEGFFAADDIKKSLAEWKGTKAK